MDQPRVERTISLRDVKNLLDEEGLRIEMFKFVAQSYKKSWQRTTGVLFKFGSTDLGIGPTEGAPVIVAPSTAKLDMMDHNPYAVYALVLDFMKSKLKDKGIRFLVEDIEVRLGPQKDPLVIEPRRVSKSVFSV